MHRTTAATLIVAGIVGLSAGTVAALVRSDDDPVAGTPTATARPSGTPGNSPTTEEDPAPGLLYVGKGRIVDGNRTIRWDAPDRRTTDLTRTADGYLVGVDPVAGGQPGDQVDTQLWLVDPDGTARSVASVRGRWDLDRNGERIVGTDAQTGNVTTWSLTGSDSATWRSFAKGVSPVWVGDEVLVSAPQRDGGPTLVSWDPATGKESTDRLSGFDRLTATVAGDLLGGQVDREGLATGDGFCLASRPADDASGAGQWSTCDWRSNVEGLQYSPDGSRVLAIPAETDGFGPGVFGIFSATEGPRAGVTELDAPDATLGAEWLGNDRVAVYGASDIDLDDETRPTIRVCDLDGTCEEPVVGKPGEQLVVAGVR